MLRTSSRLSNFRDARVGVRSKSFFLAWFAVGGKAERYPCYKCLWLIKLNVCLSVCLSVCMYVCLCVRMFRIENSISESIGTKLGTHTLRAPAGVTVHFSLSIDVDFIDFLQNLG